MTGDRRPASRGWLAVAVGLPLYAFLYDNATSLPGAAGHAWTRLTPLSREVRIVEIGAVLLLLAVALSYGVSRITRVVLVGSLCVFGLGLASYLRTGVGPPEVGLVDAVRLIYMYLLPLWLFVIALEAPFDAQGWRWMATTVLVWTAVSAVASWAQLVLLGYPVGDDITGLNKDAHANGTLMMLVAIQLCAFAMFERARTPLLAALLFLVTMVFSSVLKVMFFGIAALAVLFWMYMRSERARREAWARRGLEWALVAGLTITSVVVVFLRVDVLSSERMAPLIEKLREDPASLGPLQAHQAAAAKVWVDLPTLLTGRGPFRFANPISVGQVLDSGRLGRQASGEVLAVQDEKGESTRITLSSSLLAEFGAPAFLIALAMYVAVWRTVLRACADRRPGIRLRASGALACLSVLLLTSLSSLFGSFDTMSVSWPVMLLAGVTCRLGLTEESAPMETAPPA